MKHDEAKLILHELLAVDLTAPADKTDKAEALWQRAREVLYGQAKNILRELLAVDFIASADQSDKVEALWQRAREVTGGSDGSHP